MDEKMLKFTVRGREMPAKRESEDRTSDFAEIYETFLTQAAESQAGRCSQCGVPFCSIHCPLGNNIPDWLKLAAEERLEEAYEVSSATNNMPEICGRICPQDRLCEGSCVIEQSGHDAVTIGAIERFVTDTAWQNGWVRPIPVPSDAIGSVGIVGAGPAGMTAAEELRQLGFEVHIYDRYDRAGGLLTYGIPGFKLEKTVVARRVKRLKDAGVVFHAGFEVGKDATLNQLRDRHDAVLIATGVYKARDLAVPVSPTNGVCDALDYLTIANKVDLGDRVDAFDKGDMNAAGKDVVVIGGGDTAMDCVRTAVRQGASSVKCLYRRDRANMPGSRQEVVNAEEEGVDFIWLAAPKAILGKKKASAVRAIKMRLGLPDASGRQVPEEIPGSEFDLSADLVIKALGFDPEDMPKLFEAPELGVSRWGTLRIDPSTCMTSLEGVFAAGDIVRGASLVVWAIKDGRDAAQSIHSYIKTKTASISA